MRKPQTESQLDNLKLGPEKRIAQGKATRFMIYRETKKLMDDLGRPVTVKEILEVVKSNFCDYTITRNLRSLEAAKMLPHKVIFYAKPFETSTQRVKGVDELFV